MKERYGHMGDFFDDIKEIYSSLPVKAKQRIQLLEVAEKLADMSGEFSNLQASFGDFYEEKERALGVQRV